MISCALNPNNNKTYLKHKIHSPERYLSQRGAQQQRQLLRAALWLTCLLSLVIGILNVTFAAWLVASFNFITFACAGLTLLYLRNTERLAHAAWAGTVVILLNLAAFLWVAAGNAYSLMWITVVPPLTYFLLGRRDGTLVTLAAFIYTAFVMLFKVDWNATYSFTLGAFLNITEVLVVQLLLFLYYERSRRDAYQALAILSETDKLTGLHNRQKLDGLLNEQLDHAHHYDAPLVAVLADIDFFKAVNDSFGHLHGDQVLQHVARQLTKYLRQDDHAGRWGGEEFLLILPGVQASEALAIIERLRRQIESSAPLGHHITMSFGLAQLLPDESPTELVARSDAALYSAKELGRNRSVVSS